ncbi:cell division protein FtsX [Pseudothioclava arenosa]|uniref:Cell division protein FtsX n=1 Tax=Pseudothioclava arenosa TaxID=1795308 RepID=A0A2A4CK66_9RHOB|nr:cell division protein FtsX [Pseudothioclava arenosa]PCD75671.1 cell division protein FtsX [Pseudothioclava arenosa]
MIRLIEFLSFEKTGAGRVVPPTGFTARLTLFTAAAMAFLAVFALALSMATGRLADRWSEALARSATIRISAPAEQMETQLAAVLNVLSTTPGIASYRALELSEMEALLGPWFGPDLPVDALPLPRLVEVVETDDGVDAEGLRLRLSTEAPGAVFDDHTRWRRPLVEAAERLRSLGLLSLLLIGGATAGMITLAAQAALAANGQVIRVLRLVGAQDRFIARAFVRRFTARGFWGAMLGTLLGIFAVLALPEADDAGGFLTGLGFAGAGWLWPLIVPPLAALVAYVATRFAALRMLRRIA